MIPSSFQGMAPDTASETETLDGLDEFDDVDDASEDDDNVDGSVLEDMRKFEQSFSSISSKYRLMNRIGEGTFSTVYKAEVLDFAEEYSAWRDKPNPTTRAPTRFVAIKKIYVTSSPSRIFNELELLYDLRTSPNVCPLITAFRHHDQVIAILPYYRHKDFRDYFREFSVSDMRWYFYSLFTAVKAVHARAIVHRDIKPTNFLYSPEHRRGVLVDFGLAEREATDWHFCACNLLQATRRQRYEDSVYYSVRQQYKSQGLATPAPAIPKEDQRSSRRANRAGTRGFRAPEVLLKCTLQTRVIDVWSCGVILLTLLSRRFPFFHSADDIDAFIELATIFGRKKMSEICLLHGQALETNLPTVSENGHSLEKIILWATTRNKVEKPLDDDELEAVDFLKGCLELNPLDRLSARNALAHPFIASRT